jgi:hypothetical protein
MRPTGRYLCYNAAPRWLEGGQLWSTLLWFYVIYFWESCTCQTCGIWLAVRGNAPNPFVYELSSTCIKTNFIATRSMKTCYDSRAIWAKITLLPTRFPRSYPDSGATMWIHTVLYVQRGGGRRGGDLRNNSRESATGILLLFIIVGWLLNSLMTNLPLRMTITPI